MNVKILNEKSIPNLPWQDRPADCQDVIWRYKANPIIKRNILPTSNSVFNSAVVPFEGGFAGVFRVDDKERNMQLHAGFSKDGMNWDIQPERIQFETDIPEMAEFQYGYDPRDGLCRIRTGVPMDVVCDGVTIACARTEDMLEFPVSGGKHYGLTPRENEK